jgi:hypothetical protein
MNITLKTKIRYNGQEYSSVDQLPPEVRSVYEHAIAGGGNVVVKAGVAPKLVVNGRQFSSVDEMSEGEKKLYEDAMQLIRDNATAKPPPSPAGSSVPEQSRIDTKPATLDSGWLTRKQIQLIIVIAGVLLALALIVALRQ